jgi:cobalt/nickel transport system permease protein
MLSAPVPMHIPDGFLSVPVALLLWVISVAVIAFAFRRVSSQLGEREVPVMGVLAAAIFAGQMLNFTVTGGTSGHLLGAALATILLGPWASIIIMTCVVSVQALIFQDGGLVVLGANIFNMAVVGTAVAYMVFTLFRRVAGAKKWGIFGGSVAAAWSSIFVAALACALELALSGTSPANLAIPAMAGIHTLIGIGEALITLGAVSLIFAARPDLLKVGQARAAGSSAVWVAGGLLTLVLAVLSPLASSHPDGLEWVAKKAGFLDTAQTPLLKIIPNYAIPGISNTTLATILAGVVGAAIVLVVALAVAYNRRKHSS